MVPPGLRQERRRSNIYYNQLSDSQIWLLTIYAKSRQENAPARILRALKEELIGGYD